MRLLRSYVGFFLLVTLGYCIVINNSSHSSIWLRVQPDVYAITSSVSLRMSRIQLSVSIRLIKQSSSMLTRFSLSRAKGMAMSVFLLNLFYELVTTRALRYSFAVSCAGFVNTYAGPIALNNIQWKVCATLAIDLWRR